VPHFPNHIWSAILAHEDTELNPGATREAINAFESECSFVLPDAHREFLLRCNGGIVGYCRLFGVGSKDYFDLKCQVIDMSQYIEGLIEKSVFPIASDWGGSFFCYDLRSPLTPLDYPVLYWNHEYSEEPEYQSEVWSEFAPNFVSFIEMILKE